MLRDGQTVEISGQKLKKIGDHKWISFFVSKDKRLVMLNNDDGGWYFLTDNSKENVANQFDIMGYRENVADILKLF